eukprot:GHVT01097032.1.p1 GENE.GHVT01097032.1~~GHVT01097032.1.p1  ORF type:complete len:243 (+),score=75.43 GHVT01097032.1:967-1695(+)
MLTLLQSPLVIVPSMASAGQSGQFRLHVFASEPLKEVFQLDERRNVAVVGGWAAGTAGGSHLFDGPAGSSAACQARVSCPAGRWLSNPRFLISVAQPSRLVVTVARVEAQWRKQTANDSVGCMLGFYLLRPNSSCFSPRRVGSSSSSSPAPWRAGELLAQSSFLAGHEVHMPVHLVPPAAATATDPPNEVDGLSLPLGAVVLVPTTYAPEKFGDFIVSVSSDVPGVRLQLSAAEAAVCPPRR